MADRIARVWNGSAWESISAPIAPANAIAVYQATEPSSPITGQLWIDSDAVATEIPVADDAQFIFAQRMFS